jgi:hypothetical protein
LASIISDKNFWCLYRLNITIEAGQGLAGGQPGGGHDRAENQRREGESRYAWSRRSISTPTTTASRFAKTITSDEGYLT